MKELALASIFEVLKFLAVTSGKDISPTLGTRSVAILVISIRMQLCNKCILLDALI